MPAQRVYDAILAHLKGLVDPRVDAHSLRRLALWVLGILKARHASPARVAKALHALGLSGASAESVERRLRRTQNDTDVRAEWCVHRLARVHLALGKPSCVHLVVDPTTQEDRYVLLSVGVCYRGRVLPLAWSVWQGNVPLVDEGFWERVDALLGVVAALVPAGVQVLVLADRAFGTPAFVDLVTQRGWHYLVRVQGQTRLRDPLGREGPVASLVRRDGLRTRRAKRRGQVFKKRGWREASVVVYWGRRHQSPLCLVSDLGTGWHLVELYRRRYATETLFRDYKSAGWHWEQGQVRQQEHIERILVAMALACWFAVLAGAQVAEGLLRRAPTGRRRTRPPEAKVSLLGLGLQRIEQWLGGACLPVRWAALPHWEAPNWSQQIANHHLHAYILAHNHPNCQITVRP